jgi:3-hydroxyisobutyrate dehydrogenase-like beta-hydroxyacid dehydrogenase
MSAGDPIPTRTAVTVIGLGPMGQAMARALMADGHPVTVWNRTASRADGLVADGAMRATTPEAAVRAADLVILSLTDYQAMDDILGPTALTTQTARIGSDTADALEGRTIVNLSSDTPARTRDAAAGIEARGARFLAGGVMNPAPMVGGPGAYVYYSGPREVLDAHEATLRVLGDVRYVGEDPGLAQLWYQAQLDVFLTALSAVLHATALVGSAGVTATEFVPEALRTLGETAGMLAAGEDTGRQIDTGVHPGGLSTAEMMGATAAHIVGASEAAGVDLALPRAVLSHYERAIAAGHAKDNWTSLFEVIKAPTE